MALVVLKSESCGLLASEVVFDSDARREVLEEENSLTTSLARHRFATVFNCKYFKGHGLNRPSLTRGKTAGANP